MERAKAEAWCYFVAFDSVVLFNGTLWFAMTDHRFVCNTTFPDASFDIKWHIVLVGSLTYMCKEGTLQIITFFSAFWN